MGIDQLQSNKKDTQMGKSNRIYALAQNIINSENIYQNCGKCKNLFKCPYKKEEIEDLKAKAKDFYNEEVIQGAFKFDDPKWVDGYNEELKFFTTRFVKKNINGVCLFEKKQAHQLLITLSENYDLAKPHIRLISREIIMMSIQSFRADLILALDGMEREITTKKGSFMVTHPMIDKRLEYSRRIQEAIEKMDKMVNGIKQEVKLTVTDVLEKLDIIKDDQKGVIDV